MKDSVKKFFLSSSVIVAFIVYAFQQKNVSGQDVFPLSTTAPSTDTLSNFSSPTPTPTSRNTSIFRDDDENDSGQVVQPQPIATSLNTPSVTNTPSPTSQRNGAYRDGTYQGDSVDAYYGYIQVQAVVQNGKLQNVQFLDYPRDRSTSIRINSQALPILKQESIQTQSANVNVVSGATDSSEAFRLSIASALKKA